MSEKKTKTLLILNYNDNLELLKTKYEIREHYTLPNKSNILFVIFYNLKESERCYKELHSANVKVFYTISKYELPKDQEKCDRTKNQSTLFINLRNNKPIEDDEIFKKYGEIRDIRNANLNIKCVEYYDSRSADKCYSEMHNMKYNDTEFYVRYVWDMSTKTKWDIIRFTDNIISQISDLKVQEKKVKRNTNMFLEIFDEFISENIDQVYNMMEGNKE